MPRSARLYYPGGVFHIISRCHAQEYLLHGEEEREHYLKLLAQSLGRTDARLLAWCIMSNHVHLVVMAGREQLSRLTKPLNTGFAGWKNRKEKRIGAVFADRPKTVLVETEPYLLELVRYVHLNPVRAGLVDHAELWEGSSHRFYAGLATPPPWLHMGMVMSYFPNGPRRGPKEFVRFVEEACEQPRRPEFSGQLSKRVTQEIRRYLGSGAKKSDAILGTAGFIQQVLEPTKGKHSYEAAVAGAADGEPRIPGPREIIAAVCTVLDLDEQQFREHPKKHGPRIARRIVTWLWIKHYGQPQSSLAKYLNVGADQVSRWFSRAIDSFEEIEPQVCSVLSVFPEEEPDLAAGAPAQINVNVNVLRD